MDEQFFEEHFGESARQWRERLQNRHLEGFVGTLLEAVEPLATIGAQLLYVCQPTLGLFMKREAIQDWATLLETPGGLAWFRQQLAEPTTMDQQNE